MAPRKRSIYLFSGLLGLLLPALMFGQVSYRTSQALQVSRLTSEEQAQANPPQTAPFVARRFLGWKHAEAQGTEYLREFSRSRARTALPMGKGAMTGATPPSHALGGAMGYQLGSSVPPGLELRPSLPAGFIPTAVVTGDFNGDGQVDWVVSNGGDNNLWMYFGRGDGTSDLPVIIPLTGSSPVWLTAADVRGIGILDLIVAEADSGTVGVLLGRGDGSFGTEVHYGPFARQGQTYPPASPTFVLTGDFNGDGKIDVVVGLSGGPEPGQFAFLPGDGSGQFGSPAYTQVPGRYNYTSTIAAADLNRDGNLDLMVNDSHWGIITFLGKGDGTFARGQVIDISFFDRVVTNIVLGDLNEDGCPDAVTLDSYSRANVFIGKCDGTFQTPSTPFPVGDVGIGVALADLNGDGHLDLVAGGVLGSAGPGFTYAGNFLCVLLGDGRGAFSNARVYRGDTSMFSLSVADLNGDGRLDVVTANQLSDSATVFLNDGQGGFGDPQGLSVGYGSGQFNAPISGLIPTDLDGDGRMDLVLLEGPIYHATPCALQITALLNDGTGKFSDPIRSDGADCPLFLRDFVMADSRKTGRPDFLALFYDFPTGAAYLFFAPNLGHGRSGSYTKLSLSGEPLILAVGDFNGDGKLDFIVAGRELGPGTTTQKLYVYLGKGDGTFNPGVTMTYGDNANHWPAAIYVGDFNRDGRLDVLVWMYSNVAPAPNNSLYEFLGNGDGTFTPGKLLFPGFEPFAMADVNHDGWLDIISMKESRANYPDPTPASFSIYLGQPDGTFLLNGTYTPFSGVFAGLPFSMEPVIGDFNGDGNIDIAAVQVTASFPRGLIQFLTGNGDGTFSPNYYIYRLTGGGTPRFTAEVNGDGKTDLMELSTYSSSINVIRAGPASSLQLALVSDPVPGLHGQGRVTLNVASSTATTVSLSATDPAITLPASVEIPAGTVVQGFDFNIDPSLDPYHVFAIYAQLGTDKAVAYGTEANGSRPLGFTIRVVSEFAAVFPGRTTQDLRAYIGSIGGYATTVNLGCQGLPAQASCLFGSDSLDFSPGGSNATSFKISTGVGTPPGSYSIYLVAQDENFSSTATVRLEVYGDFRITLSPSSQAVPSSGSAGYSVTMTPLQNSIGGVALACSNLRMGASCNLSSQPSGYSVSFQVFTRDVAPASYTFTVTATSGPFNHSATGELRVSDWTVAISPTSASFKAGGSANFTVTGTSRSRCPTQSS